jgi:hypothetical protein
VKRSHESDTKVKKEKLADRINAHFTHRDKQTFIVKIWRPLTQKELPDLSSGDTVILRQNYLSNPDRLLVTYVRARCVDRLKREGNFVVEGTHKAISTSLTEVGRYVDTGWQMTGEELSKLRSGDPVWIYADSGEVRPARFETGASPYTSKVIFEGETEPTSVGIRSIGRRG